MVMVIAGGKRIHYLLKNPLAHPMAKETNAVGTIGRTSGTTSRSDNVDGMCWRIARVVPGAQQILGNIILVTTPVCSSLGPHPQLGDVEFLPIRFCNATFTSSVR